MGNAKAFIHIERRTPPRRPVPERIRDWGEVYRPFPEGETREQASRCMDCGIPFCHQGCPLGNLIPDWNDLVYRGRWREAIDRLHATNPFPEFTGKLCPAPCEDACVLAINSDPVTIKQVEWEIIARAWREGWVGPQPPTTRTGRSVAVIGSGPAGLAAAQGLNRLGHSVTVYERDDRIGGLLRYGIPDFKMDKAILDRRLAQLEAEGVEFRTNADVGGDLPADGVRAEHDAVVLATGATRPRELRVPGRELAGVHLAMEYLTLQNRRNAGDHVPEDRFISASGKRVVIIGGGDTGADCLGTAHRQGAASVVQLQWRPSPPATREPDNPWPEWGRVLRSSAAHEEGGERAFEVSTQELLGEGGRVRALRVARSRLAPDGQGREQVEVEPGSERVLPADLVLLAMGFSGSEPAPLAGLGLELTGRGVVAAGPDGATHSPGVFAAGDARMGQSLIVWAQAEGRDVAKSVDRYLATLPARRTA